MQSSMSKGLPGLSGMEHIGLGVSNLDEAVDFLCEVIGCELLYRHGPYAPPVGTPDSENLAVKYLGAPPDTVVSIAMLRCGNGANLELFEVSSAARNARVPQFVDNGSSHFCFYVEDIEQAVEHLRAHDVRIFSGIMHAPGIESGEGSTCVHFLAPWGQMLEVIAYPNGKLYEKDTHLRLWQPSRPETWRSPEDDFDLSPAEKAGTPPPIDGGMSVPRASS